MKNQFFQLLKFDFLLLFKYKIVTISVAVTLIYIAIFKTISTFDNIDKVMVLAIFNDPALLGFLFVGVMVLFEKNENTLEALAVTPIKLDNYILSKALSLTLLSVVCCFTMVGFGYGSGFNMIHFFFAVSISTFIFSMIGFIIVAGENSFNTFILKSVGVILFLSLPFLAYFEVISDSFFWLFPTHVCILIFDAAFGQNSSIGVLITAYFLSLSWAAVTFIWAKKRIQLKIFEA